MKKMVKEKEGLNLIEQLSSVQNCSGIEIASLAKQLVDKYPNYFGMVNTSGYPAPLRVDLIKCLISLGCSNDHIRASIGSKTETIVKYRRLVEIENINKNKDLSELEKYPHIKSKEILESFNNSLSEKLKNNIETLTERLSEQLDDTTKIQRTGIKDLAVATTLLSDNYRKVTGQDKQVVEVTQVHLFPDSPISILKNYKTTEKTVDAKVIDEIAVPDPILNDLPEEFKDGN